MSRFYATIQGSRGEATKQGSAKSGISSHVRGWDFGANALLWVDENDNDMVSVHLTGGSNGVTPSREIFEGSRVPEMGLADTVIRNLDLMGVIRDGIISITAEKLEVILNNTGHR